MSEVDKEIITYGTITGNDMQGLVNLSCIIEIDEKTIVQGASLDLLASFLFPPSKFLLVCLLTIINCIVNTRFRV